MRFAVALAALVVAGCSFPAEVISSGPRTVVIRSVDGTAKAQAAAEVECKRVGRFARLLDQRGAEYTFDCVQ